MKSESQFESKLVPWNAEDPATSEELLGIVKEKPLSVILLSRKGNAAFLYSPTGHSWQMSQKSAIASVAGIKVAESDVLNSLVQLQDSHILVVRHENSPVTTRLFEKIHKNSGVDKWLFSLCLADTKPSWTEPTQPFDPFNL